MSASPENRSPAPAADNPLSGLARLLDQVWEKHVHDEPLPRTLAEQFGTQVKTRHFPSGSRSIRPEE